MPSSPLDESALASELTSILGDLIALPSQFPPGGTRKICAYDGRYFADDGIEIVNVGPGAGAEGHATNESVPVAQLVDAALIHLDVVERLLGLND